MREKERERVSLNSTTCRCWVLTDAVVDVVQSACKLQPRRLVSLAEDTSLHEGGEVLGPARRQLGARVIATYPHQPRVDDLISDQVLSQQQEPELVV